MKQHTTDTDTIATHTHTPAARRTKELTMTDRIYMILTLIVFAAIGAMMAY